jgi:hypothetical protein
LARFDARVLEERKLAKSPQRFSHAQGVDRITGREQQLATNYLGLGAYMKFPDDAPELTELGLRRLDQDRIDVMAGKRAECHLGAESRAPWWILGLQKRRKDRRRECQGEPHGDHYTRANLSGP